MCEYCRYVDTGNDYKCLKTFSIDCGIMGNIDAGIAVSRDSITKEATLCIATGDSYEVATKINFCPMCGRKLNEKKQHIIKEQIQC